MGKPGCDVLEKISQVNLDPEIHFCMNFQTGESMQPWTALVDLSIILHDYKLGGAVCPICHVTVGLQALNISSVFA